MSSETDSFYVTQEGFLSTSKNEKLALTFADPTFEVNGDKIGVLLRIEIIQKNNFYIYKNDTSAYNSEDEVLFNEGLTF